MEGQRALATKNSWRNQDHFDWALFLVTVALAVMGVINLYSATSIARAKLQDIYMQQVYWLGAGGILAIFVASIDYRHYERLGYILYGIGLIMLSFVLMLGRDIRGSSRWLYIGSLSLQPSELMKLLLIIALAKYLHNDPRTEPRSLKTLMTPTIICLLPILLILKQPDLGTALIHGLIFLSICSLLRIQFRSILILSASTAIFLPLIWSYVLKEYQRKRIIAFLNPEANILGSNWHAHHARIAIGNGGMRGQGFMRGTQNQFLFLPDQYSDFPFAVFAEDWGFIGCFTLVCLYGFLVLWAIRIASTARDRFGAVLAIGVGALIFWHALFNLGMVVGLFPVVGVTLPLFSYGGSSVLTILMGIGLLMNVSMRRFHAAGVPPFSRINLNF
ncbi:rod shape-determining protein RodA [Pajaroellobacter abortibovis]|uniref:Cell wall polymerase n=1 Tax=Pajaroellobacter abortibovis TaxID=1882918 RepID=A0A1L6MVC3_9BACT|nr:rod shape-determining protein RodA [Pajaroellobacter abortibovis]APR99470.1 rod shape-determining protein RodA [Pajaroellobacter abortibovis]